MSILFRGDCHTVLQKFSAKTDIVFSVSVGQEPIVSDSYVSMREHMEEEPPDKLLGLDGHGLLFVAIGVVPPAEGDLAILEGKDAVVADGDPVGVPAEVL